MSTVDRFLSKIRISELSTYFDEISFVHCFNITSEEEYQYSIEEILVDLLDDDCDLKVLILRKFNPEYFNLNKKVLFHDKTFKLRTVIGSRKVKTMNEVDISSIYMVDHNLLDGGLMNIHRMYQCNWIIFPTISR